MGERIFRIDFLPQLADVEKMAAILCCVLLLGGKITAQTCSALGQNPGTAFPVCGIDTFSQQQVPLCGNRSLPHPCGGGIDLTDKNPFWYKFTCYTSGTLGFLITPDNLRDDYDWQLFDITGRPAQDVFTQKSLFVACNWSGEPGLTGASAAGTSLAVCEGYGRPLFSKMPEIKEGRQYLLLISHFTETQSGYKLQFGGGTAAITDPTPPGLKTVSGACNGKEVRIRLNKRMKCSSLATDGSDFFLPGGEAAVIAASSPQCGSSFDMDSVVLMLDRTLPPGDYRIGLQAGSDGNTLLDNCDLEMPAAITSFTIYPDVSAAFSYAVDTGCIADTVTLLHPGGNATQWYWQFDDQSWARTQYTVKYLRDGGERTIRLTVSNTHCTDTSSVTLHLPEKLRAAFDAPEILCAKDPAVFTDHSTGNISQWSWDFGNGSNSSRQQPDPFAYGSAGRDEMRYDVRLTITDPDGCYDTAIRRVTVAASCVITVPSAFTPNNDGRNDHLFPTNAFNANNLLFRIYNRFGQLVFESRNWQQKWDGNVKGQPQPAGAYVWTLEYVFGPTGKAYRLKGTTLLIR